MTFWKLQLLMAAFVLSWLGCAVQGQRLAAQHCEMYLSITLNPRVTNPLSLLQTMTFLRNLKCTDPIPPTIGGEPTRRGEFPHHALLGYQKESGKMGEYEFRCGGTLISQQHVLTAAHCVADGEPEIVRFGLYNIESWYDISHYSGIAGILRHPDFSLNGSYHDIALIKLERSIRLSIYIRPACVVEVDERDTDRYIAIGFGFDEPSVKKLSKVMTKVQLDEFDASECGRIFKDHRLLKQGIKDGQLCVGSSVHDRDTCQGDLGGPLQVVTYSGRCTYAVVGITSMLGVCGNENTKAIYTKVSNYIDWIEDNVWGPNAM